VDKIVGPGNQWVAAAKRLVFGLVDIDSVAGPSEVMIACDGGANPCWVAADLLAQAEHDQEAHPVLVVTDEALIERVELELEAQLAGLPRADIARGALERHGVAVVVGSAEEVLALADDYAPEHLELLLAGAEEMASRVRHAGAVFVGPYSPEAAGDYLAGPNHVLPTGGSARWASPLGVYDFVKRVTVIRYRRADLAAQWRDIAQLARVEGLEAHARSVTVRFAGAGGAGDGAAPGADGGGKPAAHGREERDGD
jgi:histidinol dehydrogenase